MISFPSTANESKAMYGEHKGTESYSSTFDVERIKALNLNTSYPVIKEQLKPTNINAGNFQRYPRMSQLYYNDLSELDEGQNNWYENPLQLPASAISLAKDYDWIYKNKVKTVLGRAKEGNTIKADIADTDIVPSMFNPLYGVNAVGMLRNTPLLNDSNYAEYDKNIDDCSIRTLCTLSKSPNSPIGMHRYKYADFMYCKDLGKVANNHLITLRKFAHPIGDHIGALTAQQHIVPSPGGKGTRQWKIEGDVGRLVTWFGTDDNKLEDIAKFTYHATWKELNSEIQEMETKADSSNTGILGLLSNSYDPAYNDNVGEGYYGSQSIWAWLGSKVTSGDLNIGNNKELLWNYDKNKIYTPRNTIQSNHIYEGKIEFTHEFTLTFSYELRAYDNINPRSAFLDLLGNILEVTGRRGTFWKGQRKLIGPPQSNSLFDKVYNFTDGAVDNISGWISTIANGGMNFSQIMGTLSSGVTDIFNQAKEGAQAFINGGWQEFRDKFGEYLKDLNNKTHFTEAVKGMIKNKLGRPQLYAWHSFVEGDDVGLWHVTVGNPKAPILSIGNLILVDSGIQQSGPLGVDDFPTQLKVTVTLKHARPRDISDIGRMYTGGTNALYQVLATHRIEDFYDGKSETKTNANTANDTKKSGVLNSLKDISNVSSQGNIGNIINGLGNGLSNIASNIVPNVNQSQANSPHIPTTSNGLLDPSIVSDTDINIMRKNTWDDKIFEYMRSEVA